MRWTLTKKQQKYTEKIRAEKERYAKRVVKIISQQPQQYQQIMMLCARDVALETSLEGARQDARDRRKSKSQGYDNP